mmetsp:Transcript_7676/g.19067  ORF Transcript_7676/g.19067 Transcript_7676/m.19067 type:complete len:203 (-) Transcript_7676:135-743(-)
MKKRPKAAARAAEDGVGCSGRRRRPPAGTGVPRARTIIIIDAPDRWARLPSLVPTPEIMPGGTTTTGRRRRPGPRPGPSSPRGTSPPRCPWRRGRAGRLPRTWMPRRCSRTLEYRRGRPRRMMPKTPPPSSSSRYGTSATRAVAAAAAPTTGPSTCRTGGGPRTPRYSTTPRWTTRRPHPATARRPPTRTRPLRPCRTWTIW